MAPRGAKICAMKAPFLRSGRRRKFCTTQRHGALCVVEMSSESPTSLAVWLLAFGFWLLAVGFWLLVLPTPFNFASGKKSVKNGPLSPSESEFATA